MVGLVVCLFDFCRMQIDITVMSSCNDNSESAVLKKVSVMGFWLHDSGSESEYRFVCLCISSSS